jgi:hypothetical protein
MASARPDSASRTREGLERLFAWFGEVDAPQIDGTLYREMCRGFLGRPEEGLAALAEAFDLLERNSERFCETELRRLRGELLLLGDAAAPSARPSAEASFDAGDAAGKSGPRDRPLPRRRSVRATCRPSGGSLRRLAPPP